jgi:DNA replication protein DnaC
LVSGENLKPLTYSEVVAVNIKSYNLAKGDLPGYDCPICSNKGFVAVPQDDDIAMQRCMCMAIRQNLRNIEKSGLSSLLDAYTFATFKTETPWQMNMQTKAKAFLTDYQDNWFFIGGQVGCGKTHICTAIAGEMMKQGKTAKYMLWRDDAVMLKGLVTESADYSKAINEIKKPDVLYIDDLFKTETGRRPTTADINLAFEILNYRYNNRDLVTILSSEYSVEALLDFDEAIGSRIYQRTKNYCLLVAQDKSKNLRVPDAQGLF